MSKSKRDKNLQAGFITLLATACSLIISVELFRHREPGYGFAFFAIAAFALAGYFAFQVPTQCGVLTTMGLPCRNPGYGFLVGCHAGSHGRAKLYARLGIQHAASRAYVHARATRGRPVGQPAFGQVVILVSADGKPLLATCLSVCATAAGVVSAIAAVIALRSALPSAELLTAENRP